MKSGHITRAGLMLASSVILLSSCNHTGKKTEERSPVKVGVEKAAIVSSDATRKYSGKVTASRETVVSTPFPAHLQSLQVSQGQSVAKGQTVAKLSSETVESTLSMAEATLRQAQDGYDRLQSVKDNGSVPAIKIVEVETALQKAKAAYNTAKKASADCALKAPFAGTVSSVLVECGEELQIAQPVVKIVDLNSLEITISVPETEISSMTPGMKAAVSVPAVSDRQFSAVLVRKGVDASAVSHSYSCSLRPESEIKGLMPGMIADVRFESRSEDDSIVIPASAVRSDRDGRYVWTVSGDNKVAKQYIETGGFSGTGIIVSGGIEPGDRIITEGMSKVSTGMSVEAVPASTIH